MSDRPDTFRRFRCPVLRSSHGQRPSGPRPSTAARRRHRRAAARSRRGQSVLAGGDARARAEERVVRSEAPQRLQRAGHRLRPLQVNPRDGRAAARGGDDLDRLAHGACTTGSFARGRYGSGERDQALRASRHRHEPAGLLAAGRAGGERAARDEGRCNQPSPRCASHGARRPVTARHPDSHGGRGRPLRPDCRLARSRPSANPSEDRDAT